MNIYEDYIKYMNECSGLIDKLYETDSPILLSLDDVIKVTDYIYRLDLHHEKIEDELAEIFEIGYGYLANTLTDLKTYYEDYYDKNIEKLNEYSSMIIYAFYVEDLKCHLEVNELLDDDTKEQINKIAYDIDLIIANKKPFNDETLKRFEVEIDNLIPVDDQFKPVYVIFSRIVEELQIY